MSNKYEAGMVSRDTFALVVPTFNRAGMVEETVKSALDQVELFDEIIVVDDGSTDDTIHRLSKFREGVSVIAQSNSGVQVARNRGVAAAKSNWIVLCDSDDLLCPEYLAVFKSWVVSRPEVEVIYCNFTHFGGVEKTGDKLSWSPFDYLRGASIDGYFAHEIPDHFLRNIKYQPLFCSGVMVRKVAYESIGGFDCGLSGVGAEDWDFTLKMILRNSVAVCMRPLVKVRRHSENDSGNGLRMLLGELKILRRVLENGDLPKALADGVSEQIQLRSKMAFDSAFAEGRLNLLAQLFYDIRPDQRSGRIFLKYLISKLPISIGDRLVAIIQSGRLRVTR